MRYLLFKKLMCYITLAAFLASGVTPSYAQGIATVLDLPKPGTMVNVSASFVPPILKGIHVDVKQPFKFDFILDTGNSGFDADTVQDEANKLIRYFLASLTIPEKDLWVNLSPYEKDRIIHDDLGLTEMGRDMLAQDYILKQITASLIYPESETGKAFWAKVYEKAFALYGTTDIPVDTFNKVWIMPGEAEIYENGTKAFVTKATLKVMLESDYLAMENNQVPSGNAVSSTESGEVKDILRDVVVPILEKEVNEGQNFSLLRQIYYSLILAKWYKDTLKDSILNRKYSDQNKVQGVDLEDKDVKQKIYARYLQAFKTGVFNYIKEEQAVNSAELIPRKYFSGGVDLAQKIDLKKVFSLPANAIRGFVGKILRVGGSFDPAKKIVPETETFSLEDTADDLLEKAPPQGLRFFTKDRGLQDYLQMLTFISPSLRKTFEDHLLNTYKVKGEDFVYVEEGAGFGQALNDLRGSLAKAKLYGIDIKDWVKDPKALKEALGPLDKMIKDGVASAQAIKEKYIARITNPGYEFVLGDITDVEFPKAADLVTSFFVLQYLDDPLAAVANAFNQLAQDGMLVMHLLLPSSEYALYDFYETLAQDIRDQGASFEVYKGEQVGEYLDVVFVARRAGNKKISFDLGSNKKIRIMMGRKNGLPFDINVISYYAKKGVEPVRVTDSAENSSAVDKLTPETLLSFADHGSNRLNDTADMEKYGKGARRFGIKAVVNTGEQAKGPFVYFFDINERHKDVAREKFGEENDKHLGYELQAVKMPDGTVGIVGVVMRSQLTDGREVPAEDKARGKAILLDAVVKESIIDDSDDVSKELYVDYYKDPLHQQELADFIVNITPPVINGDVSFDNKYKIEVINQQFSIALANHPDELKKYLRAFETGRLPVGGFEEGVQKELMEHFLRVRNDLGVLIDVEHPQGRPLWQVDARGQGRILKSGNALTQKEASAIRHYIFGILNSVQGFLELALMEPSEYQQLFIDIMHRFYNEAQSVVDLSDLAGRPNSDIVAALDQRLKGGAPLTIRGLEQFLKKRASGFDHIAQVLVEYMRKEAGFNVGSESFGTAFHEALKNAVIWGNRAEVNVPVRLNWGVSEGEFWVEVIDQGAPFALDQQGQIPAGIDDHYYSGRQGVSQLMWRYLSLKTKQANGDGKIGYAVDGGKAVRLEFIDKAQEKAPTQGGIDLNADRMDLRRTGQRSEFDWGMSAAELENVQINGLSPVIIQITPVQDLPAFLTGISS